METYLAVKSNNLDNAFRDTPVLFVILELFPNHVLKPCQLSTVSAQLDTPDGMICSFDRTETEFFVHGPGPRAPLLKLIGIDRVGRGRGRIMRRYIHRLTHEVEVR